MKWVLTRIYKGYNQLKPHKILISVIILSCLFGSTSSIALIKIIRSKEHYSQKEKKVGNDETSIMMDLRKLGWTMPGVLLYKRITEKVALSAKPEYRPTKIKDLIHFDKNNTTFLKKEELEPLVVWIDKNQNGAVDTNELYEATDVLSNIKESEKNKTWATLKNKGAIWLWEGYKKKPPIVTSLTIKPKQNVIFPTVYTLYKEDGGEVGYLRFIKTAGGIYAMYVPKKNNRNYTLGFVSTTPITYHYDNFGKEYITWEAGTKFSFELDDSGETLYGSFINNEDEKDKNDPDWKRKNEGTLIARLTDQGKKENKDYCNTMGADEAEIKILENYPYARRIYIANSPNFHYPKGKSIRTLILETKGQNQ